MLKVEICEEEVTIYQEDGREVVHWVSDEWVEDPAIVPAIANAIHLAHTNPDELVRINQRHIDCQEV